MTAAPRDLRQLLADAATALPGVEGRHEAELLLLHVLDKPRSWLFAHATDPVEAGDVAAFHALLARRVAGEPVAYLVGTPGSNVQAISRIRLRLHRGSAQVSVDPDESDTSPIALSKVWLEARQLDARRLMAFRLDMAGMEPSLHEGDTLIISAAHVEPQDGCVFAVNYEGELVFRRLVRDGGLWWMYADHTDQARFPRKTFDDRATLIGRVVHKLSDHI